MTTLRFPLATYRLQFNQRFNFKQTLDLVNYFYELGISDLYASPIMKATPGSIHGYDVVDCCMLNPEIGSEEELDQLATLLKKRDMGFLVDTVPNHMCVSGALNKWWQDVLENGPVSIYAHHFNIIWNPPKAELKNKILLPVLDQQFGKVIESQELKLIYEGGAFFIKYKGNAFPVNPKTWPVILKPVVDDQLPKLGEDHPDLLELQSIMTALEHLPGLEEMNPEKCKERNREKEIIKKRLSHLVSHSPFLAEAIQSSLTFLNGKKGDPHSFDLLEDLLESQTYRLSFWRVTNDEINYRRFFDINDLVSMKVENEDVFIDMHELLLKYIKQGWVTGLRIDHVDGLFDPQQYFVRLQSACAQALGEYYEPGRHFFVLVEKILGKNESLRPQWLVFGTTGYEYLNLLNGVFIIPENHTKLQQIYDQFIGYHEELTLLIYHCKKLILFISMSSELHILARHLEEISEQHRWSRDYTLESLRSALRDIIACFPVYRSYIRIEDSQVQEEDREYVIVAIKQAIHLNPAIDPSIFEFIESVLLLQDPPGLTEEQILHRRQFIMRFQQLTGPVMAKGVEDTAFYRSYPLASLNEVGMDPKSFGTPLFLFHRKNRERFEKWPHTLLTTFTHDTKRSEDVRARINVLSENPEVWKEALYDWHQLNLNRKIKLSNHREVPDVNEEFLLYQTLIGSWPLYPMDAPAKADYIDRIEKYMIKAIKEAKIHTSWINPNEAYEKGVREFIYGILNFEPANQFLINFQQFIRPIVKAGMFNSLSQTVLKMTTPGIPDFYQGSELWEFTLVDPDNRRPVDYSTRQYLLTMLKQKAEQDSASLVAQLMETPEDGRIKLYLTFQVLNFRRQHPALFKEGNYLPLEVLKQKSHQVVAFSRRIDVQQIIVATGRFFTHFVNFPSKNPIGEEWGDTSLLLPSELKGSYRDIFSGDTFHPTQNHELPLQYIFSKLPLAVLEKIS